MAELAEDRPKIPRPPGCSILIAVALEAGIVATFITYRSVVGLVLCLAYAHYSAIRALAFDLYKDD